jgi:hypothetical protein
MLPLLFSLYHYHCCLGILLTYIDERQACTNSKHISCDPYLLLPCDVTAPAQAAGQAENTGSSIIVCWTVFTELLPGIPLIKSITVFTFLIWYSSLKKHRRLTRSSCHLLRCLPEPLSSSFEPIDVSRLFYVFIDLLFI